MSSQLFVTVVSYLASLLFYYIIVDGWVVSSVVIVVSSPLNNRIVYRTRLWNDAIRFDSFVLCFLVVVVC